MWDSPSGGVQKRLQDLRLRENRELDAFRAAILPYGTALADLDTCRDAGGVGRLVESSDLPPRSFSNCYTSLTRRHAQTWWGGSGDQSS